MADFGYKVYVTKGELATIMGPLAYGSAKRQLRSGTSPLGTTGLDITEVLDENTGIWLDNPEIVSLFDALAGYGIITAEVRQKVTTFVSEQSSITDSTTNDIPIWTHRISLAFFEMPPNLSAQYVSENYLISGGDVWSDNEWIYINTSGAVSHPNVEEQ